MRIERRFKLRAAAELTGAETARTLRVWLIGAGRRVPSVSGKETTVSEGITADVNRIHSARIGSGR